MPRICSRKINDRILTEPLKSHPLGTEERCRGDMRTMDNSNEFENKGKPAPRYNVDLAFEFKRNYARQSSKAEVRNISLTGALIKTDMPLKPSEKLNVYL